MHNKGVLHLDINSDNIFISDKYYKEGGWFYAILGDFSTATEMNLKEEYKKLFSRGFGESLYSTEKIPQDEC